MKKDPAEKIPRGKYFFLKDQPNTCHFKLRILRCCIKNMRFLNFLNNYIYAFFFPFSFFFLCAPASRESRFYGYRAFFGPVPIQPGSPPIVFLWTLYHEVGLKVILYGRK